MIKLSLESFVYAIEPLITNIVSDIVITIPTDIELIALRNDFFNEISKITKKKHFFMDKAICDLVKTILLNQDAFSIQRRTLFDIIQLWVKHIATRWDAKKLLPILISLQKQFFYSDFYKHEGVRTMSHECFNQEYNVEWRHA